MKHTYRTLSILFSCMSLSSTVNAGANDLEVQRLIKNIRKTQEQLDDYVTRLEKAFSVGTSLKDLKPIAEDASMDSAAQTKTKEGLLALKNENYSKAKDLFQEAWEKDPNNGIANYNLALVYYHLGNKTLAKRLFKSALDDNPKMRHAEKIKAYIAGRNHDPKKTPERDPLSKEETLLRTEVINLKKEAESYMRSTSIGYPQRMRIAVKTMNEILEKIDSSLALKREFLPNIADIFTNYELYERSLETLKSYEKVMEGKVLPDGYHTKKLALEEKATKQESHLKSYSQQIMQENVKEKLSRDLRELGIFGTQMEEFVAKADVSDTDFSTICERLKEYRWGNKTDRHVIVVNRYQELLYSSLQGTLPLDRYRDKNGSTFLKDITFLAEELPLRKTKYFEVDLNVGGRVVPYVVMFTYIPKHESFIIVRLPKEDLT